MGHDLECPYCGFEQSVCHDDGFGYDEDRRHEMECSECEKTFVFEVSISFHYYPKMADCLNGSAHELKDTSGTDGKIFMTRCQVCDFQAYGSEIAKAHAAVSQGAQN